MGARLGRIVIALAALALASSCSSNSQSGSSAPDLKPLYADCAGGGECQSGVCVSAPDGAVCSTPCSKDADCNANSSKGFCVQEGGAKYCTPACIPGASAPCSCKLGLTGEIRCGDDHRWQHCDCPYCDTPVKGPPVSSDLSLASRSPTDCDPRTCPDAPYSYFSFDSLPPFATGCYQMDDLALNFCCDRNVCVPFSDPAVSGCPASAVDCPDGVAPPAGCTQAAGDYTPFAFTRYCCP